MAWWVWLIITVALSAAEAAGGEFVLLMLGAAGLVTTGVAIGVDSLWFQLLAFAVSSLVFVFGLRPPLKRHFIKPNELTSGIDAIRGAKAVVVSTVDTNGGQVKIGGEIWSAIGADHARPLPPGTPVTVVEIRGATAVVIWGP